MDILGIVLIVLALYGVYAYNRFVTLRNRVKEAWSDIDTQLKRRYDLIPNLIETVKGYMTHERETLEKVTEARSKAMSAEGQNPDTRSKDENVLTGTLKSLFAVSENYPDLKANQNFMDLQRELTDTEDKIQASRRFYNTNVLALNNSVEQFPSNIIAKVFKFSKSEFFELDEAEKEAASKPVKVSFK